MTQFFPRFLVLLALIVALVLAYSLGHSKGVHDGSTKIKIQFSPPPPCEVPLPHIFHDPDIDPFEGRDI